MAHESTKILSKRGQFWFGHIQQWQPLGVTQAEYCRSHKLSVAAFRWWRGRLARQGFGIQYRKVLNNHCQPPKAIKGASKLS